MGIVVTGIGIISAIGNNPEEVLQSLQKEKSGISRMQYLPSSHQDLPVGEVKLSNDQLKESLGTDKDAVVSRTTLMGAYAIRQALDDAHITPDDNDRIAIVNGTTVGGMDVTERFFGSLISEDKNLNILKFHDCGSSSEQIASLCKLKADVCTISTACSSALNAVMVGAEMLKNHEADIIIAGGSEALSLFHLNGFNTLMILDKEQCRPFDATRAGINLGEGAAYVVLQREEDCTTTPKAYIRGYANACDAFHQTASSEDGQGACLAMQGALQMAGMKTSDIQYINAHGTGTPNNDASESAAIIKIFGKEYPNVSSTKAYTGHTTSASGSIELVICILAMQHSFVPSNIGWKNPIENVIIPYVGNKKQELNNVMCNAFGFGGNDSSLILSKEKCDIPSSNTLDIEVEQVSEYVIDDAEQLKDSKDFISPMEARRMGKLLKAATLTSLHALKEADIEVPDAIITATAYGMTENSEKFLKDMIENGETLLKPTLFMQSTHNTIGSNIAIRLGCHGYNITYSQGADSWSWAMKDAVRLIKDGKAENVLVGCHDESTPLLTELLTRAGIDAPRMLYSKSVVLRKKKK